MAEFMNRHPGGYTWKSRAEKDFLPFMEKLPESWLFWHEPVIHKGYTPDFALWMSEPAHPALLLIELKNWQDDYVVNATASNVTLKGHRIEENPVAKLKRVRDRLNQSLSRHYETAPGLEDLAVIPVLAFWGKDGGKINPYFVDTEKDVITIGGKPMQAPAALAHELVLIAGNAYSEIGMKPPIVSREIRKAVLSGIDLTVRARRVSVTVTEPSAQRNYGTPLPDLLDEIQERTVKNTDLGHRVISGVTGTGKTILLTARAAWFTRQFPEKKQLFIVTQQVLRRWLHEKYRAHYDSSPGEHNISFKTYRQWISFMYREAAVRLKNADGSKADEIISEIVEKALKGEIRSWRKDTEFGHIYIDEAHQMPTSWIKLLARFAEGHAAGRPNIWIAYDNGQGIYRNRRFRGTEVGLNFQGRSIILRRLYRCGLLTWLFAACCHPQALDRYREQLEWGNSGKERDLEFTQIGEAPRGINKATLEEQAKTLADFIEKNHSAGRLKLSEVVIFYSVMNLKSDTNERVKTILDRAFATLGGIEWVGIDKSRADWVSEKVRACPFTSSQGLDAPVSVLFSVESFNTFLDSEWVDVDPLFYTVLTRASRKLIVTYATLNDPKCRFQSSFREGFKRFKNIKEFPENFYTASGVDGKKVFTLKWDALEELFATAGEQMKK